ncbi:MAG: tetratricopeptide repeat protein, partial [Bryobacteraceae bacterium]
MPHPLSIGAAMKPLLILILCLISSACAFDSDRRKKEYLKSGNDYFDRAQYDEALKMYVKAIKTDRMYCEAYYRVGTTAMKLQRWEEAGSHLQRAIELQPGNQDGYSKLADLYLFAYAGADEKLR